MMRKVTEVFVCEFCGREEKDEAALDKHVLSHDVVYMGLERQEWKALLRAIVNAHYQGMPFPPDVVAKLLKHKTGVTR